MAGYLSTDPDAGKTSAPKYLSTDPSAGAGSDPLSVPDAVPRGTTPPVVPDSGFDPNAAVQAGVSMASAVPAAFAGNVTALVNALRPSNFGTQAGAARATQAGSKVQEAMTYKPEAPKAQEYLGNVGQAFDASKLAGLGPMAPAAASEARIAAPPASQAARAGVKRAMAQDIPGELPAPPTGARTPFAAGGSAAVPAETTRRQRAADLPVPIKLTKGQATREFGDQRFERETAKDAKIGEPLRQRYADQNESILKNFDAWVDQTGAEAPNIRATGNAVDDALLAKAAKAKAQYRAAYDAAEKAGELAAPVNTSPLAKWVNENRSSSKLAPIIQVAEDELLRLGGAKKGADGKLAGGNISINDLELIRKRIIRDSKADATNEGYATSANSVIDAITEGKGGDEYKKARALFKRYADEFKSQGVIKKLMATKPGTSDRAVAYEDVFKHSILSGSLDDVRAIRRTLQTEGETGHQAWKELQGETVKYLRDETTKAASRDVRGNPVISAPNLNKAVRELDKDGKLDFILGKQGAQKLREFNDLVLELNPPSGVVNTSNSASVIMEALDHVPVAGWLSKSIAKLKELKETSTTKKRVRESLADPNELQPPP